MPAPRRRSRCTLTLRLPRVGLPMLGLMGAALATSGGCAHVTRAVEEAEKVLGTPSGSASAQPSEAAAAHPSEPLLMPYGCVERLGSLGIDVEKENAAVEATLAAMAGKVHPHRYDALIVPGFTPLDQEAPDPNLHKVARERLDRASEDLRVGAAPIIIVSGGNAHPDDTPYNEALLMKRYLLSTGIAEGQIAIEPCALHSHTNLRNAGRFMQAHDLKEALIVTSFDQAMYFARPVVSTFEARCRADLGYPVGSFEGKDDHRVAFTPSTRVRTRGPDPRDP